MKYKERFYHNWWLYRKLMYIRFNKLGDPGFDNLFFSWHQWEIEYTIASFTFKIGRNYHKPGCLCGNIACEEARR